MFTYQEVPCVPKDLEFNDLIVYKGDSVKEPHVWSEASTLYPTKEIIDTVLPGERLMIVGFGGSTIKKRDKGIWVKVLSQRVAGWLYLSCIEPTPYAKLESPKTISI